MRKTQPPIRNTNKVAKDVYSHSGEFSPRETDLKIPCRGLSFTLMRSYHSDLSDIELGFGKGWTFNYAKRLRLNNNKSISYHDGFGREITFKYKNGEYTSPDGIYAILEKKQNSYVLQRRKGLEYRFEDIGSGGQGGRLTQIKDSNKNTLDFEYSENSIFVKDELNRTVNFSLKNGRITSIKDHRKREWKFKYNSSERLVAVDHPKRKGFPDGTTIKYTYNRKGKLVGIKSPNGDDIVGVKYNTDGKVKEQIWGDGTYTFDYAQNKLELTLPNGGKQIYIHDNKGLVKKKVIQVASKNLNKIDKDNRDITVLTTTSKYNSHGELISRKFPSGKRKIWKFDDSNNSPLDRGNLLLQKSVSRKRSEDPIVKEFKKYNKLQKATEIINEEGNKFKYKYDRRGNLKSKIYPRVKFKDLSSKRDKSQDITFEYSYNKGGQIISKIDGKGNKTEYAYYKVEDYAGRRGKDSIEKSAEGGGYLASIQKSTSPNTKKIVASYEYNDIGKITKETDGRGNSTLKSYDRLGKLIEVKEPGPSFHTKNYSYDKNGNAITKTYRFERRSWDADRKTVVKFEGEIIEEWKYDKLNNTIEHSIKSGNKKLLQKWKRNKSHKVEEVIFPDGSKNTFKYDERNLIIGQTKRNVKTTFTHAKNGKVRSKQIEGKKAKTYHYDGFDRLNGCKNPNGTYKAQKINKLGIVETVELKKSKNGKTIFIKKLAYDKLGRMEKESDILLDYNPNGASNGNTIRYQYNASNKLEKLKTLTGDIIRFEYDKANRLIRYGNKNENRHLKYDENGNLIKDTFTSTHQKEEIYREFDEMNRMVALQKGSASKTTIRYNKLGKIESLINGEGNQIAFLQDELGRQEGTCQVLYSNNRREYLRSFKELKGARVKTYTNKAGEKTQYQYYSLNHASAGKLKSVNFPDGTQVEIEWAKNGLISSIKDRKKQNIIFSYDDSNRLIQQQVKKGNEVLSTIQLSWSKLKQIKTISQRIGQSNQTIEKVYDSLGRLTRETSNGNSIQTVYDRANNIKRIIYPDGTEVNYEYDELGRMISSSVPSRGIKNTYEYSLGNKLLRKTLSNKFVAAYNYEEESGKLSSVTFNRINGDELYKYEYFYDEAGRIETELISRNGQLDKRYNYSRDSIGRVIRINSNDDERADIELNAMNRVERVNSTNRSFEAGTDRMQRYRQYSNRTFEYDENGNRIKETNHGSENCRTKVYEYDSLNRLIKTTCYDVNDNETKIIELVYDSSSRVIEKRVTENGEVTSTVFIWWRGLLIQKKVTKNGETTTESYIPGVGSQAEVFYKEEQDNVKNYIGVHDGRDRNTATIEALTEAETARYNYLPTGGIEILPSESQQSPIDTVNGYFDNDLGFYNSSIYGSPQGDLGIGWTDHSIYGVGNSYGAGGSLGLDVFGDGYSAGGFGQSSFLGESGSIGVDALIELAVSSYSTSDYIRGYIAAGGNPSDLMGYNQKGLNTQGLNSSHISGWAIGKALDHGWYIASEFGSYSVGEVFGYSATAGGAAIAVAGSAVAGYAAGVLIDKGITYALDGQSLGSYIYDEFYGDEENNSSEGGAGGSEDDSSGSESGGSEDDSSGGGSSEDNNNNSNNNSNSGTTEGEQKPKEPKDDGKSIDVDPSLGGSDGSLPPAEAIVESIVREMMKKLRNANVDPEYAGGGIGFNEQQVFAEQGGLVADPPPGESLRRGGGLMPNKKQLVIDIDPRLNRM